VIRPICAAVTAGHWFVGPLAMGFNRRKMEDERRRVAQKEAAARPTRGGGHLDNKGVFPLVDVRPTGASK
jgi:hypothetical protein